MQPASAFVIQQSSLCVSVTIYVLWVLFNVVCQATSPATYKAPVCLKPRQRQNIRAKGVHVTDCVCLPAHATLRAGIHTVCAWSAWERFAPRRLSLRRETSPAFLVVPAPLSPRRSSGCARGNRRWIRWREWRRASPYLLPFPSDPAPTLWDRKPAPRFFPSERGLDAPPVFLRGGGRGGCRWAFVKQLHKHVVCISILWTNIIMSSMALAAALGKKRGADCAFPAAIRSAPAGHCPCLWSRGSGPAAAEARRRLRSRGSHMDLADWLETGSPYLHLHSPDLALSRGGSPRCGSSPFVWERAAAAIFLRGDWYSFLYRVARVLQRQRVHYSHSQFIISSDYEKLYIYYIYNFIYIYGIYMVYRSLLGYFLEWEHDVYLSSSEEVEVVSRGCWAGAAPIVSQLLI